MSKPKKYIFVTGGVLSSIGKGIAAASLGTLLERRGLKVTMVKMDPYLNVDPGTMSPFQHGEVFVLDDGAETDLDLGHYSRFVEKAYFTRKNSFTTGRIYDSVIRKERAGEYLGKTVQVIPHITDEIKHYIHEATEGADIAIIEVGGTVGDIEGLPFLEAIRQMKFDHGSDHVLFMHLTLVPFIKAAGELKTKPTQHSVKELREIGIQPDVLVCRSDTTIPKDVKDKIGLFCNVPSDSVFSCPDVDTIYEVPLIFSQEKLDERVLEKLKIWTAESDLRSWNQMVQTLKNPTKSVKIGVIGKYNDWKDSYKSLNEALTHAGVAHDAKVDAVYIDAERFESGRAQDVKEELKDLRGILIPGGFGERGIEGKIAAIRYARENKIPFFGICLGMQLAVIEFARNVLKISRATSEEFRQEGLKDEEKVIVHMEGQRNLRQLGGTMRLGAYDCFIRDRETLAFKAYGAPKILERHRHRFEVSPAIVAPMEAAGLKVSGFHPWRSQSGDVDLVEMVEMKGHPWFLGCQFHPEFLSKPMNPHPLFKAFIGAAIALDSQK